MPEGNDSRESLVRKELDNIVPLKQSNPLIAIKHNMMQAHNDILLQKSPDSSPSKQIKLHHFKNKQKIQFRRVAVANAIVAGNNEESIQKAKNEGSNGKFYFEGRYFDFNEEMRKIGEEFTNFPWENYNHDDFLSYLVAHRKTLKSYLDFYKDHARVSNFLRKSTYDTNLTKVHELKEHTGAILQVIMNDSGSKIITASADSTIRFWDFESRQNYEIFQGHEDAVTCIAISRDDKTLVSGSKDRSLRVWPIENQADVVIRKNAHEYWLNALILFKEDQNIISAGSDKIIQIWNIKNLDVPIAVLKGHEEEVLCLALMPDEKILFSGSDDTRIKVWNLESHTESEKNMMDGHYDGVTTLSISPDKSYLVSGSDDGYINVWNLKSYELKMTLEGHLSQVHSLYITKNCKYIVSGSRDKMIKVWDLISGKEKLELEGHKLAVNSIVGSFDNDYVISGSDDQTVRITKLGINEDGQVLYCHDEKVNCLVICPSGTSIVTAGEDRINIYSLILGSLIGEIGAKEKANFIPVEVLTITPDGEFLLAGNRTGAIMLYNLNQMKEIRVFHGHHSAVYTLKVSNDGKTLYSGSGDHLIGIWEISNNRKWRTLAGHSKDVRCLAVGKDQNLLYSGSLDGTIKVWDIAKMACVATLECHGGSVNTLAISYEKRRLFSGCEDQSIRVWNLDTHQEVKEKRMNGHTEEIADLVLSKDSRFLFSASKDKTMRVWNVDLGRVERIIEGHDGCVKGVRITPDRQMIISASFDRTVRKWVNEVKDEDEQIILEGHNSSVNKSILNKNNKYLVSCSSDQTENLKVWSFEKFTELRILKGHIGGVNSITQSRSEENIIYSAGQDGHLKVWNVETGQELQSLKTDTPICSLTISNNNKYMFLGLLDSSILQFTINNSLLTPIKSFLSEQKHTGRINQLNVTKNDLKLVSVSEDSFLIVWNISSAGVEKKIQAHQGPVLSVTSTNKVKTIISGGADGLIKIWDIETGQEKMQIKTHKEVFGLSLTPDDKMLLSGGGDHAIRIWRYKTGEQLNIISGHLGAVRNILLDKEAKRIISSSNDKTIRIQELPNIEKEIILRGHINMINCVVLSQDNKRIFTGSTDKSIKSWEFETGKQEKNFINHNDAVLCLCLSFEGNHLYSGSLDKTIIKWDVETEKVLQMYLGHRSHVCSLALDYEEKHLISACDDRSIRIWKVEDPENFKELEGHKLGVTCVCMSTDGYYIFSGSLDKTIKQWNLDTYDNEQTFHDSQNHMEAVRSICTYKTSNNNSSYLVSGGDDSFLRVWNIDLCCVALIFEGHKNPIFSVLVDEECKWVVSCSKDRTIRIWDLENGQETHVYYGHLNSVFGLALTNDGRQIVSVSKDQTIRIWRFQKYERYTELEGHEKPLTDLVLSPDNKFLITASMDTIIRVWNLESLLEEKTLKGHKKAVRCLQIFSKNLNLLFSGSSDHTIRVWKWMDNEVVDICLEKKHNEAVKCLAIDPESNYLASGSSDNSVLIWKIPDLSNFTNESNIGSFSGVFKEMSVVFQPLKHRNTVNCLSFSTNGEFLASGSSDGFVNLWDMHSGSLLQCLDHQKEVVNDICITKDSETLISAGKDKRIHVWNIKIKTEEQILTGHEGSVNSVKLSQDEKHIISVSADCTIKIWDFGTGFCKQTLEGHDDSVSCIKICKDGKRIITGSNDETVKIWWIFDPNFCKISLMIKMLEMHSDDHQIAKLYPKFKEHAFSESIFPLNVSIFHYYCYLNDSLSIERILNILNILENKLFILTTDIFHKTPVDIAFECRNKRILNALFSYVINKPPPINGFPNFASVFQKAIEFNLPNVEKILDSRLISLKKCLPNDGARFHLPEESIMSNEINTNSFRSYCIEERELFEKGLIVEELFINQITNRVEFLILDIPYVCDVEKNELFHSLLKMNSNDLFFSSKALNGILHYKWKSYAAFSYTFNFLVFFSFLILATANNVFIFPNRVKVALNENVGEKFKVASLILNIFLVIFMIYFAQSEAIKLKHLGKKLYLSTLWHFLDIITLVLVGTTIILDLISISGDIFDYAWLKALMSLNTFLLWVKFLTFARGYKQTAFMVRMILQVIYDIKVFLAIFFILCLSIGFSMFVIKDSDGQNEMNYLAQFSIFNSVYRIILGDNGYFDNIEVQNGYLGFLLWLLFFVTSLFMMIIMLNLLISILGDSYDKISGREVLASNFEKTWILYETDALLSDFHKRKLRGKGIFEKYLVVVKVVEAPIEENQNERIRKKIDRIEEKIDEAEEKFKEMNRKMREKNEVLEYKMERNYGNSETLITNLQEKICGRLELSARVLTERRVKK